MRAIQKYTRLGGLGLLMFSLALAASCDLTATTAESTSEVFVRAGPAFEAYWDYDLAGTAAPASIVQLEGILRVVAESEGVHLQLSKAYMGYAFGWVQAEAERLEFEGDYEGADEAWRRANKMFLRAKDLATNRLRMHADGVDEALNGDLESLEKWLDENFEDEEDGEVLFWPGFAWGSQINSDKTDMDAVGGLAFAKALVSKSIELNPKYFNAGGHTFMGVATTNELQGDLDKAEKHFEHALTLTERRALLIQVNMARHYAVKRQNRELFDTLITEVLEAGDRNPPSRLANRIARNRAEMYKKYADDLF